MDIASFILGMCTVVAVGSLIVTVVSLVKIKRTIMEIDNNLEVVQCNIDAVYRSLDLHVDKIMSKISILESGFNQRRGKTPSIPLGPSDFPVYPLGPSDFPVYPRHVYDVIACNDYGIVTKDNTTNQ